MKKHIKKLFTGMWIEGGEGKRLRAKGKGAEQRVNSEWE